MKSPFLPRSVNPIPKLSSRTREALDFADQVLRSQNLFPYLVEIPAVSDGDPLALIGDCGTNDSILKQLCWLTDARDDAFQDLLAAFRVVDTEGKTKANVNTAYRYLGVVKQLDGATATLVAALIKREQAEKNAKDK